MSFLNVIMEWITPATNARKPNTKREYCRVELGFRPTFWREKATSPSTGNSTVPLSTRLLRVKPFTAIDAAKRIPPIIDARNNILFLAFVPSPRRRSLSRFIFCRSEAPSKQKAGRVW